MKIDHTNYVTGDVEIKPNMTIGKFNSIAVGVFFHCDSEHPCISNPKIVTSHSFYNAFKWTSFPEQLNQEKIIIENDVWIATEAKILEGVTIGNGAIIGAYSVVTKDVPPFAFVAGNPARLIRYRFSEEIIKKLQKIKWWDWGMSTVRKRLDDFLDIYKFVEKYGE